MDKSLNHRQKMSNMIFKPGQTHGTRKDIVDKDKELNIENMAPVITSMIKLYTTHTILSAVI